MLGNVITIWFPWIKNKNILQKTAERSIVFAMLFCYSSAAKQALYILAKIGYNYIMEVCILF